MNRVQCLRIKDMINDYLDGSLDNDDRKELFDHIEGCEDCQAYFEDMKAISDCMAEDLLEDLPEGFEEALRLKLQAVAMEQGSSATLNNVSEFRKPVSKATKSFGASNYKQYMPGLSAAAVVVLAFGVTLSGTGNLKGLAIPEVNQFGSSSVSYDTAVSKQAPPTSDLKVGAAPMPESAPLPSPESAPTAKSAPTAEPKAMMAMAPSSDSSAGAPESAPATESATATETAATDGATSRMVAPTADQAAAFTDVTQGKLAQQGHKIIQSGNITLETLDMSQSAKQLQDIVLKNGGFIESANVGDGPPVYEPTGEVKAGTENLKAAWYHLRIPAEKFESVMAEITAVGKETNRSVNSQDITTQYVDNESQLKNLRAREESLRQLMAKTTNIKDLLEVDRELTGVRSQIDSLASQKKTWDGQISLSSIDVNLNEVKNYSGEISKTPEGVSGVFKKAMVESINALIAVAIKTLYMIVLLLPYVILFAVVYGGMNKWMGRKHKVDLKSETKEPQVKVSENEAFMGQGPMENHNQITNQEENKHEKNLK